MRKYEAIRSYYTTKNDPSTGDVLDFVLNHERGLPLRDRRGDAITDGFQRWEHDDFNIAVWDDGVLVSWDWMDEPVEDADGLAKRAREVAPR